MMTNMANIQQIKALLKAHASGDEDHFYSVAMQMAASEAKAGHGKSATELKDLIDSGKERRLMRVAHKKTSAIGDPRGELAELLDVVYPTTKFASMVLDVNTRSALDRVLIEQKNQAKIRSYGLSPRRKLLLVGPPGTGKTLTATALAGELGLPLYVVRLDH
jgi:SpoVK/Ycf46/Vps4 family AAA+-type ATPase